MSQISTPRIELGPERDIPALEADVAYFEARLSLLNDMPHSLYHRAQLRAYGALEQALNDTLDGMRREAKKQR